MHFLSCNESVAVAWRAGKRQMMVDTTRALGNGLLIGKDAARESLIVARLKRRLLFGATLKRRHYYQ
jgi:hypothetical protein